MDATLQNGSCDNIIDFAINRMQDCSAYILKILQFRFNNRPFVLLEMVESVDAEDNEEGDGFVPSEKRVCNATCIVELPAFSIVSFLIMGSAFRW